MKNKLTVLLIGLVLNLSFLNSTTLANSKGERLAVKVKASVGKLGIGKDAKISVKLKDGTKIRGYISETKSESFLITNETTGINSEIQYSNVKQVKGNNLSTGVKVAIGIGILLGIILVIALVSDDGV